MRVFLGRVLQFTVGFFEFSDFCGQLHVAIVLLMQCMLVEQIALHILPCKAFFQSTVQIVLLAVTCVVGVLHTPMLLA